MKRQAAKVTTWIFILSLILAVAVSSQDPAGTQYLALRGRTGGQVAQGGKAAGDDLTLQSTEHATKGTVILANDGSGLSLPTSGIFGAGHLSGLDADTVDGLHAFELGGGGGYTNEQAQDAVGTIFIDSPTIDFTYDDATPFIRADVIGGGGGGDCFSDPNCAYLPGRAGGQDLIGDTQASGFLGLRATSHSSGGTVFIQTGGTGTTEIGGSPNGNVDIYGPLHWNLLNTDSVKLRADGDTLDNILCVNCAPDKVGIGTASPSVQLDIVGAAKASASLTTPTVYGGSATGDDLTLESTSHPTKGDVFIAPGGGATSVGGTLSVANNLDVTRTTSLGLTAFITNVSASAFAYTHLALRNAASTDDALNLYTLGTNYTTSGAFHQDGAALDAESNLSGGLSIVAEHATTGDIRFYTGGSADANQRLAIDASGIFSGAGHLSGLNADLLDGLHASDFVTTATDTELAQDAVGTILTDTATINFTYDDATPQITADARYQMSIAADPNGLLFLNDQNAPGINMLYGTDPTGAKGWRPIPANAVSATWIYDSTTTMADPGSGKVRSNNIASLTTQIAISRLTQASVDVSPLLGTVRQGDTLTVQDQGTATNRVRFLVTAPPTDNTNWFLIPVSLVVQEGTSIANGAPLIIEFSSTSLGSGSGGGGHTIQDEGSALTARSKLNFVGAGVVATDNSGADTTIVTIDGATNVIATADAGLTVTYVDSNSVSLVPSGADAIARLTLYDSSATDWKLFEISSTETASLGCSGAANCLDTSTEAASTFYHLWAIGKLDGTFDLLLSVSASAPTMPSGYTFKGLIGGVSNDGSSNIFNFQQLSDGRFMYTGTQVDSVRGLNVLNGGTSITPVAVVLDKAIPNIPGIVFGAQIRAANGVGATNSIISISEDAAQTIKLMTDRTIGITGAVINAEHWEIEARNTGNRSTSLYYDWSVNNGSNQLCYVWVKWWSFGQTAGAGASSAPNFSDDEGITGTIDGSNPTFTLAHDPNPDASLQFVLNGVVLKRAVGYTLSGTTVTMQTGYVPESGAVLSAFFRY